MALVVLLQAAGDSSSDDTQQRISQHVHIRLGLQQAEKGRQRNDAMGTVLLHRRPQLRLSGNII